MEHGEQDFTSVIEILPFPIIRMSGSVHLFFSVLGDLL